MSSESHHSGTFDKLFHHKHRDEHHEGEEGAHLENHDQYSGDARPQQESEFKRFDKGLKKEENKFKNYLQKDEELEEEGKTYGGLM
ncbi:uncharacterized protein BHQ10_001490 [Talaromyces amestolkiae]|uniref:Uncharacterized protein n=1 Tax=Talaromyces amestolkiae TaxID=1196081 RepID=A0A364KPK1_TALAM|nr:uncharacterized protein BHQ10_001490 [Talaromyces amestolkiae]RAO65478.1 hypothetical protein BHQ10_001490 [Talaromyces amestolkiae]